jgi:hypothetical protein
MNEYRFNGCGGISGSSIQTLVTKVKQDFKKGK